MTNDTRMPCFHTFPSHRDTLYLVRCTLSDEVLDFTHLERATLICSRFLFSIASPWRRFIWLATPGFHTNKVSTSVQPSPGAHRRCYLLLFTCLLGFFLLLSGRCDRSTTTTALSCVLDCSRRHASPPGFRPWLSGVKEQWCSPARVPTTVSDLLDTPLDWRRIAAGLPKHTAAPNLQHR